MHLQGSENIDMGGGVAGMFRSDVYGLLLSSLAIQVAYRSIKNGSALSPFYSGIALIAYGGEIYGAYRTVNYYQSDPKSEPKNIKEK